MSATRGGGPGQTKGAKDVRMSRQKRRVIYLGQKPDGAGGLKIYVPGYITG